MKQKRKSYCAISTIDAFVTLRGRCYNESSGTAECYDSGLNLRRPVQPRSFCLISWQIVVKIDIWKLPFYLVLTINQVCRRRRLPALRPFDVQLVPATLDMHHSAFACPSVLVLDPRIRNWSSCNWWADIDGTRFRHPFSRSIVSEIDHRTACPVILKTEPCFQTHSRTIFALPIYYG